VQRREDFCSPIQTTSISGTRPRDVFWLWPSRIDVTLFNQGSCGTALSCCPRCSPRGEEVPAFAEAEKDRTLRSDWGWAVKG
jgi:hypothetical protein